MKRKTTFLFFIATVIAVGVYFFQMVQPFLLPLLMAGTLALLVQPVFARAVTLLRGHRRPAAILVSIGVVLVIVLPVFVVLGLATQELIEYGGQVVEESQQVDNPELTATLSDLKQKLPQEDFDRLCDAILSGNGVDATSFPHTNLEVLDLIDSIGEFRTEEIEKSVRMQSGAAFLNPKIDSLLQPDRGVDFTVYFTVRYQEPSS